MAGGHRKRLLRRPFFSRATRAFGGPWSARSGPGRRSDVPDRRLGLEPLEARILLDGAANIAVGDPLIPSGLTLGDSFHLAFVSSTQGKADNDDIEYYNGVLQGLADASSLGGMSDFSWKVIGSTAAVDARDNAVVSAGVYRTDGVKIADDPADFWDGSHDAVLDKDENGAQFTGWSWTYTGSNSDGTGAADGKTMGNAGSEHVYVGYADQMAANWAYGHAIRTDNVTHYYALSQQLVVAEEGNTGGESGNTLDPVDGTADLDTGSADRGGDGLQLSDWDNNFAYDVLYIGEGDTITLVGNADVGGGSNALYARKIEGYGGGSTIDLNGHNVYLQEWATGVTFVGAGDVKSMSPLGNLGGEFVGPFDSWLNVKTDFGAVGDGVTDDTAAIQAAFESLKPDGALEKVLYFPAGTYRIVDTVAISRDETFAEYEGISVIGEDPATTTIKWDGAAGGRMMEFSAYHAKLSRLTFDGMGQAGLGVHNSLTGFTSGNELSDLVFKDMAVGIRAGELPQVVGNSYGAVASETAMVRLSFLRMSDAGIRLASQNTLDQYIWNSRFEDCRVGVTNESGAGNFAVYESVFLRSTLVDVWIAMPSRFYSLRHNISIGSGQFLKMDDAYGIGAMVTVQGNTIIDPTNNVAINFPNPGPLLLLDNVIKSRSGHTNPVVAVSTNWGAHGAIIAAGNTFTVANPISLDADVELVNLQEQIVSREEISTPLGAVPATPRHGNPTVFDLPVGAGATAIQVAIDQAAALDGQRPVVHLPSGNYTLDTSLVIPANTDMRLMGDGIWRATTLHWAGSGDGPMLQIDGPTHAGVFSLRVSGGTPESGPLTVVADTLDQPGARIHLEQPSVFGYGYSMVVDQLDHAYVSINNATHYGIHVIGGSLTAAGEPTDAYVDLFQGLGGRPAPELSAPDTFVYQVTDGGRLAVHDAWYEGSSQILKLTDRGEFTYNSGVVAPGSVGLQVEIDGFDGRTLITEVNTLRAHTRVGGDNPDMNVLLLGMGFKDHDDPALTDDQLILDYTQGQVGVLKSHFRGDSNTVRLPDQGNTTDAFVLDMLAALRARRPIPMGADQSGVTNLTLYRVMASGVNGVRLEKEPESQPPTVPQNLAGVAVSQRRIDLSWNASTDNVGVEGYDVFRDNVKIATVTSGITYTDLDVAVSTSYSYEVEAFDKVGNRSGRSAPVVAATPQGVEGLLGYWDFDDGAGSTADDSVGNSNGTLVGNATWDTGRLGGAVRLDGDGDYVNLGNSEDFNFNSKSFTIALWSDDLMLHRMKIAKGLGASQGWGIQGNTFSVGDSNSWSGLSFSTPTSAGTWTHLAATLDYQTRILTTYQDGVLDQATVVPAHVDLDDINDDASLLVGARQSGIGPFYLGAIDEMYIYDRVLDLTEIQELALVTVGPPQHDFQWTKAWVGSWHDSANWTPAGIPHGNDHTVEFTGASSYITIVQLSTPVTVREILIDESSSYRIDGSQTLTLDANTGTAKLQATAENHIWTTPISAATSTTVDIAAGAELTLKGQFDFAGETVIKAGSGNLYLDSQSTTQNGTLQHTAGLLGGSGVVNGDLTTSGGSVAPGHDVGELTIAGNFTMGSGGALQIEIGGTSASQFDALQVAQNAYLDGTIEVTLTDGYDPDSGQQFPILQATSVVDQSVLLGGPDGNKFKLVFGSGQLLLEATSVTSISGDYNSDGTVDAADYTNWRDTLGSSVTAFSGADGNGNGTIDQGDYSVWRDNFGTTIATATSSSATVDVATTKQVTRVTATAPSEPVASASQPLAVYATVQSSVGSQPTVAHQAEPHPTPVTSHDDALLALYAPEARAETSNSETTGDDSGLPTLTGDLAADDSRDIPFEVIDDVFKTLVTAGN